MLYLIEILHQTTTTALFFSALECCILSKFYIKPQHRFENILAASSCILSKFYIKPQLRRGILSAFKVVSYRNSTSNHNGVNATMSGGSVVSYRNSTSNHNSQVIPWLSLKLYLIEILHQTTTLGFGQSISFSCILSKFYIKPQPAIANAAAAAGCILSKFYIKPQHTTKNNMDLYVVSYRNSTSNHNCPNLKWSTTSVVSYRNSTSNHNSPVSG